MAGPLSFFRKYQKLMLGVFGVLLMFVFTLSFGSGVDPIVDYLSGGGYASSSDDPVLASFKGGQLRSSEAASMKQSRAMLSQLLATVEMEAYRRGTRPQAPRIPNNLSDEAMMERILLSREAERLGIRINDDAVLNFMTQYSGGTMQPSEFLAIWENLTGLGERELLIILRGELAAAKVRSMAMAGHWQTSPVQYWDNFNQLERIVNAEMLPLSVDDYTSKVADPTEADLRKLYDEYKERYPIAGSPEPGFKRRMRRAFDYVKFDYNAFLQHEIEKITDEQVKEYYETNKEEFRETLPESDLDLGDQDAAEQDAAEEETPAADTSESTGDRGMESEAESAEEVDEVPGSESATEAETEPAPTDQPTVPAEESAMPDDSATPAIEPATPVEPPVTPTADPVVPAVEPAVQPAVPPTPPPAAGGQPGASLTPAPQDDGQAAQTEPSATEPAAEPEEAGADSNKESENSDSESNAASATQEEEAKYRPIEDVTDSIKERLAAESAQKAFKDAISKVNSSADKFYRRYTIWKSRGEKGEQPEMPDLSELDSPVALNVQSMPLSDRYESAAYELGQAYDLSFDSQSIEQVPFSQTAYTDNLPPYQPSVFPTGEAMTKFVYWVTAQEDAYVPEFEEAKDELTRAWKLDQARELALADAEKAAAKASEAGTPLSEACASPGRTFNNTGEISWFSGGSVGLQMGGLPQPASIPGIEFPGPDLLRTIFRLKKGEVGYALDGPKSTAYVVRVFDEKPSVEQRETRFVSGGVTPAVQVLAQRTRRRILNSWYKDLLEKYDVNWTRDPSLIE